MLFGFGLLGPDRPTVRFRRLIRMAPAVFLTLVLAQSAPTDAADSAQIERIHKALTETQAITVALPTRAEDSVFRVTVHGRKPERPSWEGWSATPSYIRPWFRSHHHEFLEQVTPEEFRGATLYPPIGIPVVQVIDFLVRRSRPTTGNREKRTRVRRFAGPWKNSSRAGQTQTNPAASTEQDACLRITQHYRWAYTASHAVIKSDAGILGTDALGDGDQWGQRAPRS